MSPSSFKIPEEYARVCVVGIVIYEENCLLIKRADSPYNWCPPCGGVKLGEKLIDAIIREIKEETGLDVIVNEMPVNVWKGKNEEGTFISITYVTKAKRACVQLSSEHTAYKWIPIKDLKDLKIDTDFDIADWREYIRISETFKSAERF